MNLIIYHYPKNYSNIDLPGYLYTIRTVSMSRGNGGEKLLLTRAINYYYYFNIFHKFIKQFDIERLSLFYEIRSLQKFILYFKNFNIISYHDKIINFLNSIIDDDGTDKTFKIYANNILSYYEEE